MSQGYASLRTARPAVTRKSSGFGKTALLALALTLPGVALAEQQVDAPPGVVCVVSGYDVIIHNKGTDPLAPGTRVDWSVPFLRMSGNHVLEVKLEPEGRVFLSGVLSGGGFLDPKQTCVASLG